MTMALNLLCRVIRRRLERGENLDAILADYPRLTEEELAFYRRGKNAHVHAVPKNATREQYAKATGLEALFGALYLMGRTQRLNELFQLTIDNSGAPLG